MTQSVLSPRTTSAPVRKQAGQGNRRLRAAAVRRRGALRPATVMRLALGVVMLTALWSVAGPGA